MKIEFSNINKEYLKEKLKLINEVLNINFDKQELTEENLLKAKEKILKYNKAIDNDWTIKQAKIIVANSDLKEIATIK